MRINQFIAQATGMSRRAADKAIAEGRVEVNTITANPGQQIGTSDTVTLDNRTITPDVKTITIILNKPIGYVCSRSGQGSKTIYDLLPKELHNLKPVGRLDKDSSGILLMTNDGKLAHKLTHPSFKKEKVYEIELDKPLTPEDKAKIESGVMLKDGKSSLQLTKNSKQRGTSVGYSVHMHEGRNRQIRRTFAAVGYKVTSLHRTNFGDYTMGNLLAGSYQAV